jgi:HSP20 family protein
MMVETAQREGGAARESARPSGGGWDLWSLFMPWTMAAQLESMVPRLTGSVFAPQFDVGETEDLYTLKADLPGVRAEDLEVTVAGNQITISGKRQEEPPSGKEKRYVSERATGAFSRSFVVPDSCDAGQVQAELKHGVLTVSVHHRPEVKARKVEIQAAAPAGAGQQARQELRGLGKPADGTQAETAKAISREQAGGRRSRRRRRQQGMRNPRRLRAGALARSRRS